MALYPEAIVASEEDARVLGLNATSDGRPVVMAAQAERLTEKFAAAGFEPVTVDVSELLEGPWRREVRDARAARAGGRETDGDGSPYGDPTP